MEALNLRKDYVLVSSDARATGSASTTDFTVGLALPLVNVVKTDLVQCIMDYNIANVVAPNSTIVIEEGPGQDNVTTMNSVKIDDGLYTPHTLTAELNALLPKYLVQISNADFLSIEYELGETDSNDVTHRDLYVSSSAFRRVLGLTSSTLRPSFNANDGAFGTLRWKFPRPVQLTQTAQYLMLQSRELGNQIITSTGDVEFYRLLLNDPTNNVVSMVNNRVDTYLQAPRTIKDIDIRLLFPDKSVVNNRGGSFTLLIEVVRSI